MRRRLVPALLLLASCAVSTDPHPLARSVALDVGGRWCAHLETCYPHDFAAKFASVDACAAATAAPVPGDRVDTCDASRIDTCRADVEAAACHASPTEDAPPASCGGC